MYPVSDDNASFWCANFQRGFQVTFSYQRHTSINGSYEADLILSTKPKPMYFIIGKNNV